MRTASLAKALRDALHLDRRSIQFALVDRHDLNSSMNCAEQQKTVGLRATRSKALESGSKLLCFQYCEARGQAPPLKVAGVSVRKRCLIALVQYPTAQSKSTGREATRARGWRFEESRRGRGRAATTDPG